MRDPVRLHFVILLLLMSALCAQTITDFAQCLTSNGAVLYGAYWAHYSFQQKQMFGDAISYINYTDCSDGVRHYQSKTCSDLGINSYPTWAFANGARLVGVQGLQSLSAQSGCPLPTIEYNQSQSVPAPVIRMGLRGTIDPDGNISGFANMTVDFIEIYFASGVQPENFSAFDQMIKTQLCSNTSQFMNLTGAECDIRDAILYLSGKLSTTHLNESDGFFKSTALFNNEYLYAPNSSMFGMLNSSGPGSRIVFYLTMPGETYRAEGGKLANNTVTIDTADASSAGKQLMVRSRDMNLGALMAVSVLSFVFVIAVIIVIMIWMARKPKKPNPAKPKK